MDPTPTEPLVITRSVKGRRLWMRALLWRIVWRSALAVVIDGFFLWLLVVSSFAPGGLAHGLPLICALGLLAFVYLHAQTLRPLIRLYRTYRQMRNLRLVVGPEGVTYASELGTFTAAWSVVRRMTAGRSVAVRVADLPGPLGQPGKITPIAVPLDGTGVTVQDVARAVDYFSNRTVAVESL